MIGYPFVRYVHDRMAKEITDPYYAALAHAAGQAFGVILFPRNATVFPIYELTAIVLASEEANAKITLLKDNEYSTIWTRRRKPNTSPRKGRGPFYKLSALITDNIRNVYFGY